MLTPPNTSQWPEDPTVGFWNRTTWRDEYYARLADQSVAHSSPVQLAEKAYRDIEEEWVGLATDAADTVADLGCGTGRVTAPLVERFPGKRFIGVDLSWRQLEVFRDRLSPPARCRARLICRRMSSTRIESGAADLALLCNHTLGTTLDSDRAGTVAELTRILRPDGQLLVAGFSNLSLAPECYENWGIPLLTIDHSTRVVQLKHHRSHWQTAGSLAVELAAAGFRLMDQASFELGYVQVYRNASRWPGGENAG